MIRKMEEISMNAWPCLQTMLIDGWILRFAEGYTYRANSINPIYCSNEEDMDQKISVCEKLYRGQHLPVVFKMTSIALPANLDQILEQRDYKLTAGSLVLTLDIIKIKDLGTVDYFTEINERVTSEWIEDFCILNNKNEANKPVMIKMFKNITNKTCFMRLFMDGEVAACGLGVVEGDFIGLYDIVTNKKYRRQGFGTKLVSEIINWGILNGANTAYLQVVRENIPALNLYHKLGFKEKYEYWYRVN
jgi:GNAT superfamily N-acetyltransferase